MRARAPAVALLLALAAPAAAAAPRVLVDDFENVSGWSAVPSDGVELVIGQDEGVHGRALRLDFRFVRGGGYAVARKTFDVPLPADYRFHLAVRGATGPQNFEFKLIDSTGANVWWNNRRDFVFPTTWDSLSTRKRKIEFAWGPAGGGTLGRIAAIEFAVTAGSGGTGTVWLDDLTLEALPPPIVPPPDPRVTRTARAVSADLGTDRELSALFVTWPAGRRPGDYVVELSDDGALWRPVREVRSSDGGVDPIHLPDAEARAVRVRALAPVPAARRAAWSGARLEVQPAAWAPGINDFFARLAARAAPGVYPRGIAGEQSYWTAIGADRDAAEALVDEDGRIEPWKQGPSLEAFVRVGAKTRTWRDGVRTQALVDGDLPMPIVTWTADSLRLTTTTFVAGDSGSAGLLVLYQLLNPGPRRVRGTLAIALRPFQVNPPPQFLNTTGGAARVERLALTADRLRVDAHPPLLLVARPHRSGVAAFDEGDVVADFLARARSPAAKQVHDPFGHASALLEYDFDLPGGEMKEVSIVTAMDSSAAGRLTAQLPFDNALHATADAWRKHRGIGLLIDLPPSGREALETFRAQLGWLRVTRDGPALKPGARSYDRSWIRDGALSSAAMLRAGEPDIAREFATWFAQFVPDDGAVPCCVDHRGPDPTPEHDSHGEFIFLVAEILRYTGDTALAGRLWPAAERAATHIDDLRRQRQGPEWRTPETAHFYGLLPPSISHEGYSAKPMHSYWDDFFALRGLTDAAWLAGRLGHAAAATRFAASRDSFAADFGASIRAAMALHKIPYVPGCADLGDYDATSTTIALDPVAAGPSVVSREALAETFDGYWKFFERRRDGKESWDAYTPYELRTIGALVRLGQRDRANEALDWFLRDRRPAGFRHWAEVVSREERKPRFLGDMPHTWVGTDYVRSFLDLFAYVEGGGAAGDSVLIVGAGLRAEWILEGRVQVLQLPTPFGDVSYRMRREGQDVVAEIANRSAVPPGGCRIRPPLVDKRPWRRATVDGAAAALDPDGGVTVRRAPARVVFSAD